MIKTMIKKKGFTLIELLVVIAVIGLLASIVSVQLGPVRAKARDASKKQNFVQIAQAMELCYIEITCGDGDDKYIKSASMPSSIDSDGTPLYLASMPSPPAGHTYTWWTNVADPTTYCIHTTLEQNGANDILCVSRAGVLEGTDAPTAIKTGCCK